MHGDRRVSQHRLRTRGGDGDVARLAWMRVDDRIAQVPEVTGNGLVKDLVVADGGLQVSVPVDQPLAAVDESP
jgi:hypothetical protein